MESEKYHEKLKRLMDEFVHEIYKLTKNFPKEELYGVTSQLRRAALSIILNYIEGYARNRSKDKMHKNFLEISYGSFKETNYLLGFCLVEGYIAEKDYQGLMEKADKIGAMLWGIIKRL